MATVQIAGQVAIVKTMVAKHLNVLYLWTKSLFLKYFSKLKIKCAQKVYFNENATDWNVKIKFFKRNSQTLRNIAGMPAIYGNFEKIYSK